MPWLRIDDKMTDHPKISGLSDAAFRLHLSGMTYCARHLTDGFIDSSEVPRLVQKYKPSALKELVSRGIWYERHLLDEFTVYEIHGFLDWNDSREHVEAKRQAARERMERIRAKREEGQQ